MACQYEIKKIVVTIFFCLLSCREETEKGNSSSVLPTMATSGDIICRLGNGYFSNLFRHAASAEKVYSHVGIIQRMGSSIFVFHAEAGELNGVGFVKREPLESFLYKIDTYGLYRFSFDKKTKERMVKRSIVYYENKTPFDLNFDLTNDREVYCTELVANCINYATGQNTIAPKMKVNNVLFYGLDDIYQNNNIKLVMTNKLKSSTIQKE